MIHLDSFTDSFSGALWWWVETTLFCVLWAESAPEQIYWRGIGSSVGGHCRLRNILTQKKKKPNTFYYY